MKIVHKMEGNLISHSRADVTNDLTHPVLASWSDKAIFRTLFLDFSQQTDLEKCLKILYTFINNQQIIF